MKNSPNVTIRVNIWVTTANNAQITEVRNSKLLLPLEFSEIVLSIQIETHSTLEKKQNYEVAHYMLVITSYGSYWNIWKDDCVQI